MTVSPPGAVAEYSKGPDDRGGLYQALPAALVGGAMFGALLLVVAEFTTLFTVETATLRAPVKTVSTGSHHGFALLPIAALAIVMAFGLWRTRGRWPLLAIGVLGAVTGVIALAVDLPDAQSSGVVGSFATGLLPATAVPQTGLYMETLGAAVLIVVAGAGYLLGAGSFNRAHS
jgi:hypothetical protein